MDMCGHSGGGVKNLEKKTSDILCEWPLEVTLFNARILSYLEDIQLGFEVRV